MKDASQPFIALYGGHAVTLVGMQAPDISKYACRGKPRCGPENSSAIKRLDLYQECRRGKIPRHCRQTDICIFQ